MGSLKGGEKKFIVSSLSNPSYAKGYLFYMRDQRTLVAVPMDAGKKPVDRGTRASLGKGDISALNVLGIVHGFGERHVGL